MSHPEPGCLVAFPRPGHRAGGWGPRRCTRGRPGSPTLSPSIWSHSVASDNTQQTRTWHPGTPAAYFSFRGADFRRYNVCWGLFLTFLHTAMRMMMDMMMMGTNVRTAANNATWENRAAPGQQVASENNFFSRHFIHILQCLLYNN